MSMEVTKKAQDVVLATVPYHQKTMAINPSFNDDSEATESQNTKAQDTDLALQSINPIHWSSPGQAAFDFRSDFHTTPTLAMLTSIISTTLLDDEMKEDPTTNSLQDWIASLTGHESALLTFSGTMSNQVVLRTALTTPPYSILADHRGHILNMEAGGAATLCGALIKGVVPSNGHHLTLDDVKKHAIVAPDIYDCPTRIISLENTLFGTIMPLSEIRAIAAWAKAQSPPIHMHLDGARLWEAVASNAGTLHEFCSCFDSVSLCFTKGLGAPIGSMVVGSSAFITRARWMRKLLGGGLRQTGIIAAPSMVAVRDVFLGGKLKDAQDKAQYLASFWQDLGGRLMLPTETNMVWLDLDDAGVDRKAFQSVAEKRRIKIHTKKRLAGRLVIHYQICQQAIESMCFMMKMALRNKLTSLDDVGVVLN